MTSDDSYIHLLSELRSPIDIAQNHSCVRPGQREHSRDSYTRVNMSDPSKTYRQPHVEDDDEDDLDDLDGM